MADPLGKGAREQLKDEVLYGADNNPEETYEIRPNPQTVGRIWRLIVWNQLVYIFEGDYPRGLVIEKRRYPFRRIGTNPPNYFAQSDYIYPRALLKDKVVAFLLRSDVWSGEDDDYRTWRKWERFFNRTGQNLAFARRKLEQFQRFIIPGTIIPLMLREIYQTLRRKKSGYFLNTCYKLYEIIRRANGDITRLANNPRKPLTLNKADDVEIALRTPWRAVLKKQQYDINQKTRADKEKAKEDAAAQESTGGYPSSGDDDVNSDEEMHDANSDEEMHDDDDPYGELFGAAAPGPSQFRQFIRES